VSEETIMVRIMGIGAVVLLGAMLWTRLAWAAPPAPVDGRSAYYTLVLAKALPGDRNLTLHLLTADGKFVDGLGKAMEFNKVAHDVDVSKLALDGAALSGQVAVTINPDAYNPPNNKSVRALYTIQATVGQDAIRGTFSGRYNVSSGNAIDKLAEKSFDGALTGTVAAKPSLAGLLLCNIHLEDAAGEKHNAKAAWGCRAFPRITFKDGKPVQAVIHGHGNGAQVNYMEAVITEVGLKFADGAVTGPLTAKETTGDVYVYDLKGKLVGHQFGGTFAKKLNGKDVEGSRFHGSFEPVPDLAPGDAIWNIELIGAVAGGRQFNGYIPCRGGAFGEGMGYCGKWNHTYHDVDGSGLKLAGNAIKGQMKVTMNPDPYVPPDRKPVPCSYAVDAKLEDGCVSGTFSGTFGGEQVSGHIVGRLEAVPPVPEPASVNVKLDDGVCDGAPWLRRVYCGFVARGGRADKGGISNNKDGWTGTFKNAAIEFDGVNFKATIEGKLDTTRGPKLGDYTFKLTGKAIGDVLVGKCDTYLNGKLAKQNTDFMGGIGPVRNEATTRP
jgi:hypothetical protein